MAKATGVLKTMVGPALGGVAVAYGTTALASRTEFFQKHPYANPGLVIAAGVLLAMRARKKQGTRNFAVGLAGAGGLLLAQTVMIRSAAQAASGETQGRVSARDVSGVVTGGDVIRQLETGALDELPFDETGALNYDSFAAMGRQSA